jgi:hypothetical protein
MGVSVTTPATGRKGAVLAGDGTDGKRDPTVSGKPIRLAADRSRTRQMPDNAGMCARYTIDADPVRIADLFQLVEVPDLPPR